ncbi:MAG: hypothetical protein JWM34_937 [Ilumatobacteraceae bacterium]|nr:hypothetical protein [Ilumatobacteraceae bacterium]
MAPLDSTADRSVDPGWERAERVASGLLDRSLPKAEWTHEGHLLACLALVRRLGPAEALAVLRSAIPPYNVATGVANTPTGGYHDTITVYYVWAVGRLLSAGSTIEAAIADPLLGRAGPLQWWDQEVLMSPALRAAWSPPSGSGLGAVDGPTLPSTD